MNNSHLFKEKVGSETETTESKAEQSNQEELEEMKTDMGQYHPIEQ